jgi:hypothetical protein
MHMYAFAIFPVFCFLTSSLTGLLTTAHGDLVTWGLNDSGQLGHGHTKTLENPSFVTIQLGSRVFVSSVACGGSHTLVMSREGLVWSFGSNRYGQLGRGGGAFSMMGRGSSQRQARFVLTSFIPLTYHQADAVLYHVFLELMLLALWMGCITKRCASLHVEWTTPRQSLQTVNATSGDAIAMDNARYQMMEYLCLRQR